MAAAPAQVIRLDDQLEHASIKASAAAGNAAAADPVVWENFFSTADITWQLVRGRAGVRDGDLILKGEGSTPVILAPKQPAIDWSLYQAVEIRMSALGGHVVKIKIGDFESQQKLGAVGQYNLYSFPINVDAPKGTRPLGIMPTDSLTDLVAIHSIKLIPKTADFPALSGHRFLGKKDEYRNAIYVRSPSTIVFPVTVPVNANLHFGMGTAARTTGVRFHISVEGEEHDLFSLVVKGADEWHDGDVGLARWSGIRARGRRGLVGQPDYHQRREESAS
jgi:hypothetical protein